MKNLLYWECDKCGCRTPRHPDTKPEDVGACSRSREAQHGPSTWLKKDLQETLRMASSFYDYVGADLEEIPRPADVKKPTKAQPSDLELAIDPDRTPAWGRKRS